MSELVFLPASQLARIIRDRKVSAVEVLDAYLAQIVQHNSKLNAIFETAGLRTTAGYIPLKDYVPDQDATAVARLRVAGAVILGKTNMAELAGDFQSIDIV